MIKLKQLRTDSGYSQAYVASILGITQQAYANYESGKREPDNDMLIKLSQFFNVSTDYLLGKSDQRKPTTEPTDEDIKFALFGGDDGEITDAMYEEVKRFAAFVKDKYQSETTTVYRAARSAGNTPPSEETRTRADMEKLKNAPSIKSDSDL